MRPINSLFHTKTIVQSLATHALCRICILDVSDLAPDTDLEAGTNHQHYTAVFKPITMFNHASPFKDSSLCLLRIALSLFQQKSITKGVTLKRVI